MADIPTSSSTPDPISDVTVASNPPNTSIPSPQIAPSPSMDAPSMTSPSQPSLPHHPHQQMLLSQSGALSGSGPLQRVNHLQQQFGTGATASAMRQLYGSVATAQMSFGGTQIQQQQPQMMGGMQRTGVIGQGAEHPGLSPTQSPLQSQFSTQSRQKMGMYTAQQTLQVQANSSAQSLQGMQNMGMMASVGLNSQIRANGTLSYGQQRIPHAQQGTLTSPQKLHGQNLARASSLAAINPHLSYLNQNGQSALVQNTLSQQQWPKLMQTAISGSVSPSYQLQQPQFHTPQCFMPQQLSSASLHQKTTGLSQQQISQLLQQPQQLGNQKQQQLQHLQQLQQLKQQQKQPQQQSPRMGTSPLQKSCSLSGSKPDPTSATTPRGSSSQSTDTTNKVLGKRKIQDLVSQVDSLAKLDPEVEDALLEIADDFIDSVTTFACSLAKHRKSSTLEAKDVLLHLEKNWHLTIPGYSKDEPMAPRALPDEIHTRRLEMVRLLMESHQSETDTIVARNIMKQSVNGPAIGGLIRPPLSLEQFALPTASPQMLNKFQRC